ncbi:hypothetical protein FOXB_10782 [Fusarium oxysporum f. sp. conglutinans Fo5176]|uniref:Uncharacterized protein n=1 Tax=Fusarium oxysporum (strain Fo5176) TaxID=660025 RepID=F9FWK0_FUSOF|nr:hypothetical protein FOXB_10782 [Fusarium oxysporum f. sp. conglutinans Fo5176]
MAEYFFHIETSELSSLSPRVSGWVVLVDGFAFTCIGFAPEFLVTVIVKAKVAARTSHVFPSIWTLP